MTLPFFVLHRRHDTFSDEAVVEIVLRLIDGEDPARLSELAKAMLARRAGVDDFNALKVALAQSKKAIVDAWAGVFGGKRKGR